MFIIPGPPQPRNSKSMKRLSINREENNGIVNEPSISHSMDVHGDQDNINSINNNNNENNNERDDSVFKLDRAPNDNKNTKKNLRSASNSRYLDRDNENNTSNDENGGGSGSEIIMNDSNPNGNDNNNNGYNNGNINENNNNNNNNINSNNKNNNGNHVQNPSDIPPIPPVPDLPPQMQQQMAQLLPKANNSDMDNYGPLPVDNAAPAAGMNGMNGMNNVAGLASSHDSDDDDDIILPPKDGFGMTGNVGAPPARGGRNGKQKVFPPKKKGNHQDVAMNMAIKMSGEGGGNGSGSDAPGSPGQVEGKGRPSDILALDDDDAFLDDMYAPVGKKKSLDTPGDGDGMTGDTPGGNGPPGGKPPRPIVEDDEIDVLDV